MSKLYLEKRTKLWSKLREIDRLDLKGLKETKEYWFTAEEPTCDGCIELLLSLFPEKKIYVRDIPDDPFEN
jgi:hypothetical protein